MARRVYHGICAAQASQDGSYRVNVQDIDIAAGFHFNEGDLLVVFFAVKNTVAQPHLVIYNGDTNYEISTTNDIGIFIKQQDVEADCTDAWDAGETVAFAYTQKRTNGTYYWEMINGVHASTEVYGDTKLFDDTNFDSWIIAEPAAIDSKIALTPNTLKKLYQLLVQPQDQEEEEEEEQPLGLKWEPSQSGTLDTLGYLSLGNGIGAEITYPLNSTIQAAINQLNIPTHTGQLTNNGNGPAGEDKTGNAEPFITRFPTDNIEFPSDKGLSYNGQRRIVLNNGSNEMVVGVSQDNALAGVVFGKPVRMISTLNVSGTITANGNVSAPTFIEGGTSLVNKYSPLIIIRKVQGSALSQIPANHICNPVHVQLTITYTDSNNHTWTPIGVAGYNVNAVGADSDGAGGYYANVWECYLKNSTTVEYSIYNLRNKPINVQMDVYVIYKK